MKCQRLALLSLYLLSSQVAAQTLVLVSDLNGRYGSTEYHPRVAATVEAIIEQQPAAVIITGDMVAGQQEPLLDGPHLDRMWQAFNHTVADPLEKAGIPMVVTPGNHDGSGYPEFHLERQHFEEQWNSRKEGLDVLPGSEWPLRYAARIGGVLLVSFDGTRTGALPADEFAFIENMLVRYSKNAEKTIVISHLPMWPFARGREKEILNDSRLLALLHRFNVDVYASGHHHLFYAGTDDAGMLHVAVGALGGNVRPFSGTTERQPHSFVVLEVDGDLIRLRALASPNFVQPIDLSTLPPRIAGLAGQLERVQTESRN